jgi:hypothetical protein
MTCAMHVNVYICRILRYRLHLTIPISL